MKKVVSVLALAGLGLTRDLSIGIGSRQFNNNQNAYDLSCNNAQGAVKYYVDGLPNGVNFNGSTIIVSNVAQTGSYTVRIKAVDESGQSAERIITLSISQNNVQGTSQQGNQQNGVNGNNANNNANNPNNGANNGGLPNGSLPNGSPTGNQPNGNGNQPTGNQPNAGNGAPNAPNNRLNDLLNSLPSGNAPVLPNYGNSGRFPVPDFPTAADPNLFNPTPLNIASDKSAPTPANRNPITADDVALRAASDRHQNAIKGITNLLKIIDQARANKDKAQSDIQTYTSAYNDAVAAQRAAQNDIIALESKASQIVSAINNLNITIDDLKNKIAQTLAQIDAYNK